MITLQCRLELKTPENEKEVLRRGKKAGEFSEQPSPSLFSGSSL